MIYDDLIRAIDGPMGDAPTRASHIHVCYDDYVLLARDIFGRSLNINMLDKVGIYRTEVSIAKHLTRGKVMIIYEPGGAMDIGWEIVTA